MLQMEYAINDVYYLRHMADILLVRLTELGRLDWFRQEMDHYLEDCIVSFTREGWISIPKIKNLKPRELAIVKALWKWREDQARIRNCPVGRILRDDLIVELARRKSDNPERVSSLRGIQHLSRDIPHICEIIGNALLLADDSLPQMLDPVHEKYQQHLAINQFIMTVLTDYAKQHQLAVALLASTRDIKDFVASAFDSLPKQHRVRLQEGWRAELLGPLLEDLLKGRIAIQLTGKNDDFPLRMVRLNTPETP